MSKKKNIKHDYIEEVYKERNKFIIIGLTGRTGSGCSTIATLLKSDFYGLNAPYPKNNAYTGKDDRSYSVLYNYAKKHWYKFEVITASSVILTFILEKSFLSFYRFVLKEFNNEKNKLKPKLLELKEKYKILHEKRISLKLLTEQDVENNLKNPEMYDFYFKSVPQFHKEIREIFDAVNKGFYTKLWQKIGDNIRSSGNAFSSTYNAESLFLFAQRLNMFVKILRKRTLNNNNVVHVVIDAFRNPFEIAFFKERYASFYLLAVSASEKLIKQRLFNKGVDYESFNEAKRNEDSKKGEKYFISQDIERCLELADIYFHNNGDNPSDLSDLAKLIIRYYALILHPGLVAPTGQERCMQIAYNAKVNSGCISRQVGAVVTNRAYSILSMGWNDPPKGQVPCNLCNLNALLSNNDKEAFSDYELTEKEYHDFIQDNCESLFSKHKEEHIAFCFKDTYNGLKKDKNQVYTRALHAEENSFLQLAKNGIQLKEGGILFSTASPCELCSKKAYQLGIKTVYAIDPYPGIAERHILNNGEKEKRPELKFFEGAIGRAYTALYQNMIPLKDENEMYYGINFKKSLNRLSKLNELLENKNDKQFDEILQKVKEDCDK